jgi:membrane protease YdiL (CAAX protease family)
VDAWKHGPLVGAAIYVVALLILVSGRETSSTALEGLLEVRQYAFLARTLPPKGDDQVQGGQVAVLAATPELATAMEETSRRPIASNLDRLRGGAVSVLFGHRHLVPVFLAPIAGTDPAAAAMVRWAFDPRPALTAVDLDAIRATGLDDHLKNGVVAVLAASAGLEDAAREAREASRAHWIRLIWLSGLAFLAGIGILVGGTVLWLKTRRSFDPFPPPMPKPRLSVFLPQIGVLVYFLAVMLTLGILAPELLDWIDSGSLPLLVVVTYGLTGLAGLALIRFLGRSAPGERWAALVGIAGSFRLRGLPRAFAWALGGYCMMVPAVVGASLVSFGLFGAGGNALDNPVALMLVAGTDDAGTVLLLGSVVVAAPFFEELIFRGYLFGSLRRHMPAMAAAAVSGILFGAAHLSLGGLLPTAAIGFVLAIVYHRTGDLASSMLLHGLWNLVAITMLMAVFG